MTVHHCNLNQGRLVSKQATDEAEMEIVHKFVCFFPPLTVEFMSSTELKFCLGSDDGTFGGGQVDRLDAQGQSFLQRLEDVTTRAVWRRVIQQLLERLQFDQDHHVLQEVALDIGGQVWSLQKLRSTCQQTYTHKIHILVHLIQFNVCIIGAISHPGVVVDLHTRLCVYVL